MSQLYTKDGRPLQVSGSDVYSRSGKHVGQIRGDTVFGTDGRYAGTIVGDRVVYLYRSTHSARMGSPSARSGHAGSGLANAAGSAVWGEEPDFPD
ncbi:hypothetical protein [Mycobacterium sp.]|jgi:hypothetical protein|uniref:hypothetical protein n=1 Tax=Mycobacterium sp. TaxID=1785 RepID=UPI00333F4AE1